MGTFYPNRLELAQAMEKARNRLIKAEQRGDAEEIASARFQWKDLLWTNRGFILDALRSAPAPKQ